MSMCDCNQGRLPCTCKPIEGAKSMIANRFYAGDLPANTYVVNAQDHDRVTAECKALQERLNAADQKDDDQAFLLKDREGSRRDWFEEVQRLQAELDKRPSQIAMSLQTKIKNLQAKLAERDALLREFVEYLDGHPENKICSGSTFHRKVRTALSASAEPSAPVERDERVDFERYALGKGWLPHMLKQRADGNYEDWGVNPEWQAWQARAALDKAAEGASHE